LKRELVIAALLALAPLSAQAQEDSSAQIVHEIETSGYLDGLGHVQQTIMRCQTPDPNEVWNLEVQANGYAQRAAAVANATGGPAHVTALKLEQGLEYQYYQLANPVTPDICYQPPS
jgi:hypothetical protein